MLLNSTKLQDCNILDNDTLLLTHGVFQNGEERGYLLANLEPKALAMERVT